MKRSACGDVAPCTAGAPGQIEPELPGFLGEPA